MRSGQVGLILLFWYGHVSSASPRLGQGKEQPSWPPIDRGRQVETVQCPQPLQVIPWSRSPAEAIGPAPAPPVRPKSASAKMPCLAILIPFLFLMDADASVPYEEAMNRQIEDDVLRKFYIDMSPGHTLYEPQSVSSWVHHPSFPFYLKCHHCNWAAEAGVQHRRLLWYGAWGRDARKARDRSWLVSDLNWADQEGSPGSPPRFTHLFWSKWSTLRKLDQAASSQSEQHSFDSRPSQPHLTATQHQVKITKVLGKLLSPKFALLCWPAETEHFSGLSENSPTNYCASCSM